MEDIRDIFKKKINIQRVNDTLDITDGKYTFREMYEREAILFAVICNTNSRDAWKARYHNDGSMYDGKFIAGINTANGPIAFYFDIDPYYDMFFVDEINRAPSIDNYIDKTNDSEDCFFKLYDYSKSKNKKQKEEDI